MMFGKGVFDIWNHTYSQCRFVHFVVVVLVLNQKLLAASDVDTVTKH